MTVRLYTYSPGSASGKALAASLGILRIKHRGSRYVPKAKHTIINWGASQMPYLMDSCTVLNWTTCVGIASNKLTFAKVTDHIDWVGSKEEIPDEWYDNGGVVCRTLLTSHSGRGIVLASSKEGLRDAPLYTKYYKKKDEFRVHILRGRIIHIQRKARSKAVADDKVNWQVRNHANGFIFQKDFDRNLYDMAGMEAEALRIFDMTGLDFGAVDIMLTKDDGWKVLEVNTAPGLEGTTLERYNEAFRELLGL